MPCPLLDKHFFSQFTLSKLNPYFSRVVISEFGIPLFLKVVSTKTILYIGKLELVAIFWYLPSS